MVDSPSTGALVRELQTGTDTNPNDTSNPPIPAFAIQTSRDDAPASVLTQRTQSTTINPNGNPVQSSGNATKFSNFLQFQGNYDFNYRVFPEDLGSDEYNHYMVININVQTDQSGGRRVSNSGMNVNNGNFLGTSGFNQNIANFQGSILKNEYSKVDQLRFNSGIPNNSLTGGLVNGIQNAESFIGTLLGSIDLNANLPRNTRRIKESIALFMPTPMVYTHNNIYEEISMTAFGVQTGKLMTSTIGKFLGGMGMAGAMPQRSVLGPYGSQVLKTFQMVGSPINPKMEVLFSSTPQRQFNMEFLLAPKSEQESYIVKNIIDTLRYHAAPEIDSLLGLVPVFIPPSEFDITFYHKGVENTKIPRINTCALERVEVDYAPSGIYSTFTNGYPVTMVLRLAFRELEILHKMRVQQGF